MTGRPPPITVTPAAIARIKQIIATRDDQTAGLRIGVSTRGCSGMSYTLEFAETKAIADEAMDVEGTTILIDPKATMFLFGTEMDYVEDDLQSGFVFRNPNEKGRCGCGESFHV
ncbi:MAG: iron-sulfur cluster assembly accessory protein [Rhodospirillales bacterium]|nr:iron-sulfur cluster assembly accessory protein [Rhodospirillales bacterium]